MTEQDSNSLVVEALNDQIQKNLREWKQSPKNIHAGSSLKIHVDKAFKNGASMLSIKIKKDDAAISMTQTDIENSGIEQNGICTFIVTPDNGKNVTGGWKLSLSVNESIEGPMLSLNAKFIGDTPILVGEFTPEQIQSLEIK